VEEALQEFVKQVGRGEGGGGSGGAGREFGTFSPPPPLPCPVRPQEVLDGGNKVECGECKKRTDSAKGLKIAAAPYLLQISLKR
jgi:hypothetical protein